MRGSRTTVSSETTDRGTIFIAVAWDDACQTVMMHSSTLLIVAPDAVHPGQGFFGRRGKHDDQRDAHCVLWAMVRAILLYRQLLPGQPNFLIS